ncbi:MULTISPECIES: hypothetical protein [unclassified Maridesulfovibrio]|uniref:hypothetical protein n=1 Tax=unclassified Maridesulfovibrio TaxID=2794999 RepID=UPI003B3FDF38
MGKLEFSPMETATVTCPKCGKVFYTVKQNEEVCDFKAIANFIDGDTPFHEYFGIGNKWTEYSSTVGVYECRYCESEFFEIELCVPSEHDPSKQFIQDGFETCESEELYRVKGKALSWLCLRKINVDDQNGEHTRLFRRYDLHMIGPFIANRSESKGSAVMSCQPSQLWVDAAEVLYKYGPACLEHMREWRKEAK